MFNSSTMVGNSKSSQWLLCAARNAMRRMGGRWIAWELRTMRACLVMGWCFFHLAGAWAHPRKVVPVISVITLEKRCMGCPDEQVLRLQRDGLARLTLPGNARLGQQERQLVGQVPRRDFEALARRLTAGGFFSMAEIYEDPQMRDGSTATISVERIDSVHAVTSREGLGPPNLLAVLAELESLQKKMAFKAQP